VKPFRLGILGGMGPAAGVELHRLVINATPAIIDQDHLQVILFTDPKIPDRTTSLKDDDGQAFASSAATSAQVLERAGVDCIAMACMTAHARVSLIQKSVSVPIINGVELVHRVLIEKYAEQPVGLLATTGAVESGLYTSGSHAIDWIIPDATAQRLLMAGIYAIKAGDLELGRHKVVAAMRLLAQAGATVFVLGCTELGLLHDDLAQRGYSVVEPMRILARHLVCLSQAPRALTNRSVSDTLVP
jgi:aspartate racemase